MSFIELLFILSPPHTWMKNYSSHQQCHHIAALLYLLCVCGWAAKWVQCCPALTWGAVSAAVLSVLSLSGWLTGVRVVMAARAAVCAMCRDRAGWRWWRRGSERVCHFISGRSLSDTHPHPRIVYQHHQMTDKETVQLQTGPHQDCVCASLLCMYLNGLCKCYILKQQRATALGDQHIFTAEESLLAARCPLPLCSHWLTPPWPSKCWLLSKNLISQMEKQHLLSYSLTYGGHSCSYELKQVSWAGGWPLGDLEQRAWPWGLCWATQPVRATLSWARWTCIWNEAQSTESWDREHEGNQRLYSLWV